jgi:hypothetical protein
MGLLYSEEQLITHIKDLGKELDRVPSMKDMRSANNRPTVATYQYRFGSWNMALTKAGLTPRKKYDLDFLIEKIQKLTKMLNSFTTGKRTFMS